MNALRTALAVFFIILAFICFGIAWLTHWFPALPWFFLCIGFLFLTVGYWFGCDEDVDRRV